MKRTTMLALGLAVVVLAACGGSDAAADAQRARDLQMALQGQQLQNPYFTSPMEMGPGQVQGGGQWVYVPHGYVPQPVQQAPAPRVVYRTASVGSAPAPARATRRVTHTKRDAIIGAAAGAVAGAAIDRSVKGAVIGAAAGGVLGAVVGSTIDVDHR